MRYMTLDGCAGWLHEAGGTQGVVVVPAHGFEDLCSRHALRILADRLAAAGSPVLRLDLHGTGDSAGTDDDPDRVATWIANVRAAIRRLRDEHGVTEVTLVGLRLGALLAVAAAAGEDVRNLALLAPPASGKALLREMKVLSKVLASDGAADAGGLSVAGFRFTADTLADLGRLDPTAATVEAGRVLILSPENARGGAQLAAHFTGRGSAVQSGLFADYAPMMSDPTAALVPSAALDAVVEWLGVSDGAATPRPALPTPETLTGDGWSEEGFPLGPSREGAAILCRPAGPTTAQAVLLLNAGGIPHLGWARMSVALARRLAREGVTSLRMDGPGIGDGAGWSDGGRVEFYDHAIRPVIGAALDRLVAEGATDIVLVGSCSGAHHGFHVAGTDKRVGGLVLLNLMCFVWGPSYSIPLHAWRVSRAKEMESRTRVAEGAAAERAGLVERVIDASLPGVKSAVRNALEGIKLVSGPASRLLGRGGCPVEGAFRDLARRGIPLDLVYSAEDPGRVELERYMGPGGAKALALPNVAVHILDGADHPLTPIRSREAFADIVSAALKARREQPAKVA